MNIKPSPTTVSDMLVTLYDLADDIEQCLLIGEKVQCIHEGGELYNQLRSLITPSYLSDDEYKWLCELGQSWNDDVRTYHDSMGDNAHPTHSAILNDLNDALRRMIDDIDDIDDMDDD